MAGAVDHKAGLSRAGAGIEGRWGRALFMARSYPLGAIATH